MDLQFGPYLLKRRERQLLGPQGLLDLSAPSFDILAQLLTKPGGVIGKAELLETVWPKTIVEENTLQVHVSALRKVLDPEMIATVHGRGYKYAGPLPVNVKTITVPDTHASRAANEVASSNKPTIVVLALREPGRRSRPALSQRRHHRGYYRPAHALSRRLDHRPARGVRLPRQGAGFRNHPREAQGRFRGDGERAPSWRPHPHRGSPGGCAERGRGVGRAL